MAIKIKSAVLSASSLNVEYEEIVATPDSVVTHDFKQKRGTLIHEDLANAINALKPHFAMLCEFREVKPDPHRDRDPSPHLRIAFRDDMH